MEIKKDMVFEYVGETYVKYFIPKEFINSNWHGLILDKEFNIINYTWFLEETLNNIEDFRLTEDVIYIDTILRHISGRYLKVLSRTGNVVHTSDYKYSVDDSIGDCINEYRIGNSFTIEQLNKDKWKIYIESVEEEMIEIDGKKFSKDTIKEALKNHINK